MADSDTPYRQKNEPGQEPKEISFKDSAYQIFFTSWLNVLLAATPIAIICYIGGWSDVATFIFSLLALAPLAERLGFVTEQLALHTNETVGGLLNATFGNATELIVSIAALAKGLYKLVQLSLLGSVLSNMLLVLGTAFFFGGMQQSTQYYNRISSQVNSTLLMLSTMAILFPTALYQSGKCSKLGELGLSRGASLILFVLYFAFLYFQLFSHKEIYDAPSENLVVRSSKSAGKDVELGSGSVTSALHKSESENLNIALGGKQAAEEEDEEEEEDVLGFWNAMIWLAGITALIAVLSEAISDSIQNAADDAGISGIFLAAIVLPIVGNAAEHAGAIMFAWKGKVDLAIGVAIGSSTQISLCVLPFLVILGWMMGKDLDLTFGSYESACVLLTVISVTFAIKDGTSNWLIGATLVCAYFIISIGFWCHSNDSLDSTE